MGFENQNTAAKRLRETNLHANAETVGTTPKQQRVHFFG